MAEQRDDKFIEILEAHQAAIERGDAAAADAIGMQAMAFVADAEQDEPPDERIQALSDAHSHESRSEWPAAEKAYRRALEISEAEGNDGWVVRIRLYLSDLYAFLCEHDRALAEARAGAEAARRFDSPPVLSMALTSLAILLLGHGDIREASSVAEELVSVKNRYATSPLRQGRALIVRADCRTRGSNDGLAQADLDAAWKLIGPMAGARTMPGWRAACAHWWSVTGKLRSKRGDLAGAAEAFGKAVEERRVVAQAPWQEGPYKYDNLASALHRYSIALREAGETEAAAQAAEESAAIREQIGLSPCVGEP